MSAELSLRELSAPGRGAIRVLELAGPGALERVTALAPASRLVVGAFAPVRLCDARGELLDEALVVVLSPERVELHLHGAPVLVARVVRELGVESGSAGASLEERAAARLAEAASEAAARVLLDQAEGCLRAELEALLARKGDDFLGAARELARRGRIADRLVHPPRVVLAGPVNAGKSTLFNLLVGRERVVVDAAPGTTRDAVRERVQLGAYAVELHDTAGERELAHAESHGVGVEIVEVGVEGAGQALAAELRRTADLVLWLVPPGAPLPPPAERQRVLASRADLAPLRALPSISVLRAPEQARRCVEEELHAALELPREPWVPGAGVPFEREWNARLAEDGPAELARAVRAWLG